MKPDGLNRKDKQASILPGGYLPACFTRTVCWLFWCLVWLKREGAKAQRDTKNAAVVGKRFTQEGNQQSIVPVTVLVMTGASAQKLDASIVEVCLFLDHTQAVAAMASSDTALAFAV